MRLLAGVPDDIAVLVERALESDNPAARYSGPIHAKAFLFLKWILPDRILAFIENLRMVVSAVRRTNNEEEECGSARSPMDNE